MSQSIYYSIFLKNGLILKSSDKEDMDPVLDVLLDTATDWQETVIKLTAE